MIQIVDAKSENTLVLIKSIQLIWVIITAYLLFINLEKVRHLWWVMMHRTTTLIVHQTVEELHEFHLNSNLIKPILHQTQRNTKICLWIRNADTRQSKHVRGDRWRTARRLASANIRYKLNWKLETKCNARILIWQ